VSIDSRYHSPANLPSVRFVVRAEGVDEARLEETRREMADELERMRAQGLAAPWPTALEAREFKD